MTSLSCMHIVFASHNIYQQCIEKSDYEVCVKHHRNLQPEDSSLNPNMKLSSLAVESYANLCLVYIV